MPKQQNIEYKSSTGTYTLLSYRYARHTKKKTFKKNVLFYKDV